MKLEDLYNGYALNDGNILSFEVHFLERSCTVRLSVRKVLKNQSFQKCEIKLRFQAVSLIDVSEDFRTEGGFSDITLIKTVEGNFYLSLDPYGNTGEPHEYDNFIIIGSSLMIKNETGKDIEVL